jgi:choline-glycine betaine transporter
MTRLWSRLRALPSETRILILSTISIGILSAQVVHAVITSQTVQERRFALVGALLVGSMVVVVLLAWVSRWRSARTRTRTAEAPHESYGWGAVLIAAALALVMLLRDVRLWWAMAAATFMGALVLLLRSRG